MAPEHSTWFHGTRHGIAKRGIKKKRIVRLAGVRFSTEARCKQHYSIEKSVDRHGVVFPVPSLAWTSNRYEPRDRRLTVTPRPMEMSELPAAI